MKSGQAEILQRLDRIESLLSSAQPPLTVEDAAAFLHLAKPTIYKLTSSSQIPHFKRGKRCYFLQSDLREWITRNRVKEVVRDA